LGGLHGDDRDAGLIGGTLGAATERMMGTPAGALVGGFAAAFHSHTTLGVGIALVLVTRHGMGRAIRPQLRVAPVTAAIVLLTDPAGAPVEQFVLDRIIEIGLGGLIGVLAMVLIFPARSHTCGRALLLPSSRVSSGCASEADAERGEALVPPLSIRHCGRR
jgi:hypothetical protein